MFGDALKPRPTAPAGDPPTTAVGEQILGVVQCVDRGCGLLTFDGGLYRRGDWPLRPGAAAALGPLVAVGPSPGAEVRRLFLVREVSAFRAAAGEPWEVIVAEYAEASRAIARLACGAIEPAANDVIADCGEVFGPRVANESEWQESERMVLDVGCDALPRLLVDAVSSGDDAAGTADDADVEALVALTEARWLMLGCEGHLGLTSGLESPHVLRP